MNEEPIRQIVQEGLRDLRWGAGVAAAAPAPSRTERVFPVLKSVVQENRGSPPRPRGGVGREGTTGVA